MIRGGEGNTPLKDPGWPVGAAAIFNHTGRAAWWEGPPFGGGQWHSECRGDAKVVNAVLVEFARLQSGNKRVIVHDGVGKSFWLNPNDEPAKRAAAKVDWTFMVWEPDRWEYQKKLPAGISAIDPRDADKGPSTRLDLYTGGQVRWADVVIPEGLDVLDMRLEANGLALADGVVLKGTIKDLATGGPLSAHLRLQRIQPRPEGGYQYTDVAEARADAEGRWVLKHAPEGWLQLVAEAEGYAPRIIGHMRLDDQPHLEVFDGGLARVASISGRVIDDAGKALADVDVRIGDLVAGEAGRYDLAEDPTIKTGADGRFRFDAVPVGNATVWAYKEGYCRPGLGPTVETPARDVELVMMPAAQVTFRVEFGGRDRPGGYIVHMAPEGGEAVGKWSGSGNVDAQGTMTFKNVPPGKYTAYGMPNPGSENEKTEPVAFELKGGQSTEVRLKAK
jgi:hypothetical protein